MRTIIETLVAGVPSVYNIAGSHLEILSAEFPVSVSIQDANGIEITNGQSQNILAGTYFVPREGFDRFAITSANTQEVTIGVSFGESGTRRVAGTVTIAGTPNVTVGNLNAQKQYYEYGASFKSSAGMAVNTPETIFTGAANVNGAIVWRADMAGSALANIDRKAVLIAKSSAPVSVTDGDVVMSAQLALGQYTSGYYMNNGTLERAVLIPAGKGIYFIASAAESAGVAMRSVLYSLL